MNDLKIPTPLLSVDLEATLAEARLHWPKRELPPLTVREVGALKEGAKLIPLTRGKWAIVDSEDYRSLASRLWICSAIGNTFYARHSLWANGKSSFESMHRTLLNNPPLVDHKNGDGLDNRRNNLRAATKSQNTCNVSKWKNNSSGFKGVFPLKGTKRFVAVIVINGKRIYLGSSSNPAELYERYKSAAAQYHGEFACV